MLSELQSKKIRDALDKGTLLVQSMSPQGNVEWKQVEKVYRADTEGEPIWKLMTSVGSHVLTGGHSVYVSTTDVLEVESLEVEDSVLVGSNQSSSWGFVLDKEQLPDRDFMYDITVKDNHNLLLESGLVISNCPDRNYHFRPPEYEGDIGKYNRIFGQIWEDPELLEYLERSVDWWNTFPPFTGHNTPTIDRLVIDMPAWRTAVLWCAITHACFALATNWVADEFDYSIGGVSLTIEKSSKYESLKQNAEGQFDKATEAKARTVKFIRGLVQPKYGIGIRSSFGPNLGRGILSPRSFLVLPLVMLTGSLLAPLLLGTPLVG